MYQQKLQLEDNYQTKKQNINDKKRDLDYLKYKLNKNYNNGQKPKSQNDNNLVNNHQQQHQNQSVDITNFDFKQQQILLGRNEPSVQFKYQRTEGDNQSPKPNNITVSPNYTYPQSTNEYKEQNNKQLLISVRLNKTWRVGQLLSSPSLIKPDINHADIQHNLNTSLHIACQQQNQTMVQLLLDKGADITALNSNKQSPLCLAGQKCSAAIVKALLVKGSDVNHIDSLGNTVLHQAVLFKNLGVIDILLTTPGVNTCLTNHDNYTAQELALSHGPSSHIFNKANSKYTIDSFITLPSTHSSNRESTQDDISVNLTHFEIKGQLAKGSFGDVYLVQRRSTGIKYVMKVLQKSKVFKQNLVQYALTERRVLINNDHPNIVRLSFAFQTNDQLFLLMTYCPGGDLSLYLRREKKFSQSKAQFYAAQIVLALEYLHSKDIVYRDLKPANVVLDAAGHPYLTDFGISKENVRESLEGGHSFCGTMDYLAPEIIKDKGHGQCLDWYLLGLFLYEMIAGQVPFLNKDRHQMINDVQHQQLSFSQESSHLFSSQAKDIITGLLQKSPQKRLGYGGAEEIKGHQFFQGVNWKRMVQKEYPPPNPGYIDIEHSDLSHNINTNILIQSSHHQPSALDITNQLVNWSFVQKDLQ